MSRLKKIRKANKMTQTDVAKALGITQTAYGNYELGKRNPKPEMLRKMSRIFGCTIDELIEEADDERGA